MINLKDLWIGDLVYVSSMKTNAKWQDKIIGDEAEVLINGTAKRVKLSDLTLAQLAPKENEALKALNKELLEGRQTKPKKFKNLSDTTIDLHIEQLQKSLSNAMPQMIVQHQLMRCQVFIDQAIENRAPKIKIIHGKGNGTLKAEVISILKSIPEVSQTYEVNNGGAVEVWFSY